VNYENPVGEVYRDFAHAIIHYKKDLSILYLAHLNTETSQYDLPFWIPDWTMHPHTIALFNDTYTSSRYKASGNSKAKILGAPDHFDANVKHQGNKKSMMIMDAGDIGPRFGDLVHRPSLPDQSQDSQDLPQSRELSLYACSGMW
jgi:hypothetical protein